MELIFKVFDWVLFMVWKRLLVAEEICRIWTVYSNIVLKKSKTRQPANFGIISALQNAEETSKSTNSNKKISEKGAKLNQNSKNSISNFFLSKKSKSGKKRVFFEKGHHNYEF